MDQPDRTPATHDLGGAPRFQCTAVEGRDDLVPDPFGKQVDALRQLLAAKGLMSVDELRRGIEQLPEAEYLAATYYERWLKSLVANMVEKGVVTVAEVGQ